MTWQTRTVLGVALATLGGCNPAQGTVMLPTPDVDGYTSEVHDYIEARCGTLDCHGDPGRPARIYAETGLRMRDDLRDTPITPEELEANAYSLVAVDPSPRDLDHHVVLLKPLVRSAGGMRHVGDDVWLSRDDPAYVCLRAWLAGDVASASAECATARDAVALPPPAP